VVKSIPLEQIAFSQSFILYGDSITIWNHKPHAMKIRNFILIISSSALVVSCASQGGDDYDVSNPYTAPDYDSAYGEPYAQNDVNPTYDSPAAYEETTPAPAPAPTYTPPSKPKPTAKVHTVVSGDSLWKIGKKYGVTIDSIKKANNMTKDTVVLGSKLKIPAK
jgi:LysM repeat protein